MRVSFRPSLTSLCWKRKAQNGGKEERVDLRQDEALSFNKQDHFKDDQISRALSLHFVPGIDFWNQATWTDCFSNLLR